MMMERCRNSRAKEFIPHLSMIGSALIEAGYLVLLKSIVSGGTSSSVFIFYQDLSSTIFLCFIAFLFERNTMPSLSFNLVLWAFFLGLIVIMGGQLIGTLGLRFVPATFQSTASNTLTAVTFVLAVALGRESFKVFSLNGQAKLWGIVLSTSGAILIVLWHGPELRLHSSNDGNMVLGSVLIAFSILARASYCLLLEGLMKRYQGVISLSALICFFGTVQVGVVACLTEKSAKAWKIGFNNISEFLGVLYGGILMTGVVFFVQVWCIRKKGSVFQTAFNPLLIVFAFILSSLFLKEAIHLGSVVGAIFVVVGLYALLWAKAEDNEKAKLLLVEETTSSPLLTSSKSITETLA